MPSPFWTHHNVDVRTELPKRPLPEPLELEDGPHSPCSFMPRHSYSMMMSPAVHSRHSKINYGGGQILFPDRGDSTHTQFENEGTEIFGVKVLGSDTTASSRNPTPISEGFSKVETLGGKAGLFQRTMEYLQFRISCLPSDIRFIRIVLVLLALLALLVTVAMDFDRLSSFGLNLFACWFWALQAVSVIMERGLEYMGFLLGRAVAKIVKGFLLGYYLE